MSMPLHLKYRPKYLDDIVGNKETLSMISSILNRDLDKIPHAFLLTGPTGSGKTTLGRIIKEELGCSEADYHEFNASNTRGIDTIRDMQQNSKYAPLQGDVKVYLLDECFDPKTLVHTKRGRIQIQNIHIGDAVSNRFGIGEVEKVFKNTIPLKRLLLLTLSNGKQILTTKEHKFLNQSNEWVEAKTLDCNSNLCYSGKLMNYTNLPGEHNVSKEIQTVSEFMLHLWKKVSIKSPEFQVLQNLSNLLLRLVPKESASQTTQKERRTNLLFQKLPCKTQDGKARNSGACLLTGSQGKNEKEQKEIFELSGRFSCKEKTLRKNENQQPRLQSDNPRKDKSYQAIKGDCKRLVWRAWREWKAFTTRTGTFSQPFELAYGGCNTNCPRNPLWPEKDLVPCQQLTDCVQSGYWQPEIKNSYRDRRQFTQNKREEGTRSEERQSFEKIGVESIEIFKPGSESKTFKSFISDQERNQGYKIMYDLQIKGDPSYNVDGIIVHNCHQVTGAAQEAALKLLEDAPENVYFLLSTTNPEKLKKTLKSRCTAVQMSALNSRDMTTLLNSILEAEEIFGSLELIKAIISHSDGSPREAVKLLDSVLNIEDEEEAIKAVESATFTEATTIELCQALIKGETWTTVSNILKGIDDDPEKVRRSILTYFMKALLNDGFVGVAQIMECMEEPFFNTGKPGLVMACFQATQLNTE